MYLGDSIYNVIVNKMWYLLKGYIHLKVWKHDWYQSEVKSLSCFRLRDPIDGSLPGSFFHGILQARIVEWGALPFSRGSSQPRDQTCVSGISCKWILYHQATWETVYLFF